MPKFYAKSGQTPNNTLLYVSSAASTKWHKVLGVGIISAFNPLSINDLAKKWWSRTEDSTLFYFLNCTWFCRTERGKSGVKKNFAQPQRMPDKKCSREKQECKQVGVLYGGVFLTKEIDPL
jgi:hypothetical protein